MNRPELKPLTMIDSRTPHEKAYDGDCQHPPENVTADIMEGDATYGVRWCRLCGAYQRHHSPFWNSPDHMHRPLNMPENRDAQIEAAINGPDIGDEHAFTAAEQVLVALRMIATFKHSDTSCSLEAQGFDEVECADIAARDALAKMAETAIPWAMKARDFEKQSAAVVLAGAIINERLTTKLNAIKSILDDGNLSEDETIDALTRLFRDGVDTRVLKPFDVCRYTHEGADRELVGLTGRRVVIVRALTAEERGKDEDAHTWLVQHISDHDEREFWASDHELQFEYSCESEERAQISDAEATR